MALLFARPVLIPARKFISCGRSASWMLSTRRTFMSSSLRFNQLRWSLFDEPFIYSPSILNLFRNPIKLMYIRRALDSEFNLDTFQHFATKAVVAVSHLLSDENFTELRELFTPDCLIKVQNVIESLGEPALAALRIPSEKHARVNFVDDIGVIEQSSRPEKTWIEVTTSHWISRLDELPDFSSFFSDHTKASQHKILKFFEQTDADKSEATDPAQMPISLTDCQSFFVNARFIREFSKAAETFDTDENYWQINLFNVFAFPKDIS